MDVTFYGMRISHPARAAELMLAHKGIEAERVEIMPGTQRLLMRRHGFRGGTVPGLKLNGQRVQGSREIAHALDAAHPEPPLYPRDPEARGKVEEAELWGERAYQPVPRRIFRWAVATDSELRTAMAKAIGLPAPAISQNLLWPVVQIYVRDEGGGEDAVRRDLSELPAHLDMVDGLIEEGILGGETPSAADFQIAPTTRVLMNFPQLKAYVEDRPAAAHATRIAPDFGREMPVRLPEAWLPTRP